MIKHIKVVRPWHVVLQQWAANTFGIVITMVSYLYVLPIPAVADTPEVFRANVIIGVAFTAFSYLTVAVLVVPRTKRALSWTVRGTEPTADERERTLRLPMLLFLVSAVLWVLPAIFIFIYNLRIDTAFAWIVFLEILASGLATAAMAYLLQSRLLRQPTARVLEVAPPDARFTNSVAVRALTTWLLTSAIPALAAVSVAAFAPWTRPSLERLSWTAILFGAGFFITGLVAAVLFAKSVGEPLCEMTQALEAIEAGDLSTHVTVNDSGELGQLQAGFNRMVLAMREREQLRDLFGRHVGEDVARQALEHGVQLGGEEIEAAALFVDVIGSTTLAATRTPGEVVTALNRFFEVVVDVVDAHGGLVNKFEGDAALCIFGAPLRLDDPAAAALSAAREMVRRLKAEVPELDAGVGVSQGLVIAGNIGATQRLEYTVIGDPVNEAARLTEQAKDRPERIVASQRIVDRAHRDERTRWTMLEPLTLRGRLEPTVLAVPI
ncbi:MAG TPA: adenylate/guanylate cyclase domain-containing protein [Aeromicrobium sp.]|nr:adenylate/guanylate cyclase domain-containing protein [Aeromicrobium sp.]